MKAICRAARPCQRCRRGSARPGDVEAERQAVGDVRLVTMAEGAVDIQPAPASPSGRVCDLTMDGATTLGIRFFVELRQHGAFCSSSLRYPPRSPPAPFVCHAKASRPSHQNRRCVLASTCSEDVYPSEFASRPMVAHAGAVCSALLDPASGNSTRVRPKAR